MSERLLQRQDLCYEITFIWLTVYCYECRTDPFQPIRAFRKDKMRTIELCLQQWRPLQRDQHQSSPCHIKGMYLQSPFPQCRCYSEYGKMLKGHNWVQKKFSLWGKNGPGKRYKFTDMLLHICNVMWQPSIFMNFWPMHFPCICDNFQFPGVFDRTWHEHHHATSTRCNKFCYSGHLFRTQRKK